MRKLIHISLLLIVLLFTVCKAGAQDSTQASNSKRIWKFGGEIGYLWQYTNSMEIVYNLMSYNNTDRRAKNPIAPYFGFGIGADMHHARSSVNTNRMTINPRARFEHYTKYTRAAVDLTLFIRDRKTDPRLTPQLGYVWKKLFSINYGYNIPLGKNEFSQLSRHRISLNINITPARFVLIETREDVGHRVRRIFK